MNARQFAGTFDRVSSSVQLTCINSAIDPSVEFHCKEPPTEISGNRSQDGTTAFQILLENRHWPLPTVLLAISDFQEE